jgi:anaerobic dimethyl sulfoxide reductase subunit B (iron-sulfur subunit)
LNELRGYIDMQKTIYLDIERCKGCGACISACMDQNDIYPEKGQPAFRTIFQVEQGRSPDVKIYYLSMACQHCEDSPCVMACPTGAITRDEKTQAVVVNQEICIGCHSCALACPFGVPRYDSAGKMQKCNLCIERVAYGLQPACVRVCPFQALRFEPINTIQEERQLKFATNLTNIIKPDK